MSSSDKDEFASAPESSKVSRPARGDWVRRPPLKCPKCGGSLAEKALVPEDVVTQTGEEPFFALEVKRYYNCKKNGSDSVCDFSHQSMERPARWDQAKVRKVQREKEAKLPEPFSFAKLCDSIAIADGGRSSRNGDPVRNRRCESLGRDVLYLLERKKKIGSHTDWIIGSEDIGLAVLEVLREKGLAAMWIRYSLVFHEMDKLGYVELTGRLDNGWKTSQRGQSKNDRPLQ